MQTTARAFNDRTKRASASPLTIELHDTLYYLRVLVLPSMPAGGRPLCAAAMLVRLVSPDPVCSCISLWVLIIYVGAVLHYCI